jgi:hypothetical protein
VSTPVRVGTSTVNSMTKAQADAANLSEAALCSLPGATFTGLGDSDFLSTVTLGTHAGS